MTHLQNSGPRQPLKPRHVCRPCRRLQVLLGHLALARMPQPPFSFVPPSKHVQSAKI